MQYLSRKPTARLLATCLFALCTLIALAAAPPQASAATSAIYGRERLYTLDDADTAMLKTRYTTVILFVVDVESNGDLNYNGNHLLVQNGRYVGDPGWGARLAALKTAPTTIHRIEVCTGGSGAPSFTHIKDLIAAQGTGPGSILYRNFQVLKNALGVDAIDYDDELEYDAGSAVAFGNLVASLGMKVTLAPYNNEYYWQSVQSQLAGKVDAVYLQCYDGGAYNDPGDWNTLFGGLKVQPGDWDNDSVATVQAKMANWAAVDGVMGGFIWLLDDRDAATAGQYALAVNNGIGGPTALNAVGGSGSVALSWTAASGGGTYNVYRGTSVGGEYPTPISTGVPGTSYTDENVLGGAAYFYKVTSVTAGGEAAPTNEASAVPLVPQLLGNSGFENGSAHSAPWAATPGVINNSSKEPARSGSWDAWLNGYGLPHTDTLAQTITLPAGLTTAALSFSLHIDSADRSRVAHDVLKVQVRNSSGAVLATLGTYSNLNAAPGYSVKTFNLAAYRGQTIRLYFTGTENSSLPTSFVVDDCAVNAQ